MSPRKRAEDLSLGPSGGTEAQELVHVRATAHLPRHPGGYLPALPRGSEALVDADDPYIQGLLGGGWLIPLGDHDEPER